MLFAILMEPFLPAPRHTVRGLTFRLPISVMTIYVVFGACRRVVSRLKLALHGRVGAADSERQ
jgi:hypothetical protein